MSFSFIFWPGLRHREVPQPEGSNPYHKISLTIEPPENSIILIIQKKKKQKTCYSSWRHFQKLIFQRRLKKQKKTFVPNQVISFLCTLNSYLYIVGPLLIIIALLDNILNDQGLNHMSSTHVCCITLLIH